MTETEQKEYLEVIDKAEQVNMFGTMARQVTVGGTESE
jgi:hypothetical protein